jgi:hypothetical protein
MAKKRTASSARRKGARKPYTVFISHATVDKFLAKVLCERIEAIGAVAFRDDRDIEGGDSIPLAIKNAIRECNELVVLLTPQSMKRDWVRFEVGIAFGLECRIVPLFYHVVPEQAPAIIREYRGFHLNLNEFEDYLADLKKRVLDR